MTRLQPLASPASASTGFGEPHASRGAVPPKITFRPTHGLLLAASLFGLLTGCAGTPPIIPEPLVKPRAEADATVRDIGAPDSNAPRHTSVQNTPAPPQPARIDTLKNAPSAPAANETADITVAFDQMPLPHFIQAVYGLILKKTYSLDPAVASRKDLVTLRAASQQTPSQLEATARLLLKTYGVAVSDLGAGNIRITPNNTQNGYAPEILRGRALPEVPLPLRPIYQIVELKAVRNNEVTGWLTKIFGSKVNILDDPTHNSIILSGQGDDISAVVAAIEVLDQPMMKGRNSQRINPAFWSADELAKKLAEVLAAEGYGISAGAATSALFPINLIPIQGINALIVFAADPGVMSHVLDWARELDKPNASNAAGSGYFTYKARYTNANGLAKTMSAVLGDSAVVAPAAPASAGTPAAANAAATATAARNSRVIVDAATNTLIFRGTSENNTQLLGLLQELDKPARAALIEVTVAEVTLDDTTQLGVEWAFLTSGARGSTITGGTAPGVPLGSAGSTKGIGVGTGGLTIARLNSAGDLRLLLNALATSSNANVLSSPRILARNGEAASIQVGSEIPTINQQQTTAATGGTGGVLQSVEYRKTGIILHVKPIIYAGDRIDLDVTQEVSDSTRVGVANSPIIDTRKVETHLSLKDGTPVLLGGLISQNNSRSDTGVPLLKDIPGLGQLFRSNSDNHRKTELLVLITPYIVADDHDAQAITEAFRERLGEWARSAASLRP